MNNFYKTLFSIYLILVNTCIYANELTLKHEILIHSESFSPTLTYTPNGKFLFLSSSLDHSNSLISEQGQVDKLKFNDSIHKEMITAGKSSIFLLADLEIMKISNKGRVTQALDIKQHSGYKLLVSAQEEYMLSGNYEIFNLEKPNLKPELLNIPGIGPSLEPDIGNEVISFRRNLASWFFDTSILKVWSLVDTKLINQKEITGHFGQHKILEEDQSIITYTVGNTLRFWDYKNNTILKQKIEYNDSIHLEKSYDQTWIFSEGKMYNISWQNNEAHAVLVNDKNVKLTSKANFSADGKYALLDESPNSEKKLVLYEIKDNKFKKLFDINEPTTSYSLNPTKRELAIYNDKKLKIYSF